jgi:pyruvate dehydrogenase (quinone)/pyruvate oxidase
MTHTAADILLDTIQDWGVEVIFGLPGDGINGIIGGKRDTIKRNQVESTKSRLIHPMIIY